MKRGWQLREELPVFLVILVISFLVVYFITDLEVNVVFGTSFLIAAIATSIMVVIDSYRRKKGKL